MILQKIFVKLKMLFYYRFLFKNIGKKVSIIKPILIENPQYISIGNNVLIRNNLRIEAIDLLRKPEILIGDNCNIEQNVHIISSNKVTIGNNCSITANCAIVDTSHPYDEINNKKIGNQLNSEAMSVIIGDNCFIGIGSSILPNVKLGKHCIIGANSVVTKSFPDYSVVAGNPAKMIKRYDLKTKQWRKTDKNGEFIDAV